MGDMLLLAAPDPQDLIKVTCEALQRVRHVSPWDFHERVAQMYSWDDVACRTEAVYDKVVSAENPTFLARLAIAYKAGWLYGKVLCAIFALDLALWRLVEWFCPEADIDPAIDFPTEAFRMSRDRLLKEANAAGVD
eukprot:NODE_4859_length_547_cov_158.104418_g3559_i0.p1 GENE.NODE_4859_length_547_cov_158.104418_g3559_i0~~NODE_4859_length_547_cov_158.104418_g3559_i0.p1  ORF type:complete len:146 (-),score=46.12 NODE_4859_length_547_cov_158.104418_g3559_i0:110-517(-)